MRKQMSSGKSRQVNSADGGYEEGRIAKNMGPSVSRNGHK